MKKEWKDRQVLQVQSDKKFITPDGEVYGYDIDMLGSLKDRYLYLGADVTFVQFGMPVSKSTASNMINLTEKGFKVIPVKYCLTPQTYKNRPSTKKIIFEAVRTCDILIARMPGLLSYMAQEAAIKLGKPYIVEMVGCTWDALWNYSKLSKLYAPIAFFNCKKSVAKAEYVTYVTTNFLQKRYPNSNKTCSLSDVVLQEVSTNRILKKMDSLLRKKNNYSITTLAGVDVLYKGQHFVIEAIARLKKKGYNLEYHVAGAGDPTRLKNIAERFDVADRIKFTGMLNTNQLFELLDKTDIYIQPSEQEGLPRSVVEAMSRGCVCVGSNTGGIPELLDAICIFRKGNVKQITSLLETLLKDKKFLLQQSKTNFEKAKQFNRSLLEKKRRDFYDEFINNNFE